VAIERIVLLNVPLDIVSPEDLESVILDLLNHEGPQHIMLVSLWDVLKARFHGEFRTMLTSAALVLPVSKSLIRGARFLGKKEPVRHQPFTFIISTLGILEKYYKSLYLLGAQQRSILKAERNVHSTFPRLSIVGRFAGYYHKSMERNILTAITKAHPSLVLISDGVPGGQRWIYRNRSRLHNGIFIWNRDVIDVFSERKRRVPEKVFDRGFEYVSQIPKNPLRILRFFQYLWYNVLLLFYRLFRTSV
jgi:N-acetylglucosaminyldiphosphoundecaprenol N-acetyl-beta-D-mannosaminyltransferase